MNSASIQNLAWLCHGVVAVLAQEKVNSQILKKVMPQEKMKVGIGPVMQ